MHSRHSRLVNMWLSTMAHGPVKIVLACKPDYCYEKRVVDRRREMRTSQRVRCGFMHSQQHTQNAPPIKVIIQELKP
jgi:hypothetical protein